jgi:hypothetical protein
MTRPTALPRSTVQRRAAMPFRWLLACWLACLVPAAHAEWDAARAEALMRQSGLWQQLGSTGRQMEAAVLSSVATAPKKPSDEEVRRLLQAVAAAHAPERLQQAALQTLQRGGQPQHLPALNAWFEKPLASKITALEVNSALETLQPPEVMARGAAALAGMSVARRELLDALVQRTRSAEALTQVTVTVTLAIQRGMASVLPGAPGPTAAELRAALQAQRAQMLQAFGVLSLSAMALTYETLSIGELSDYVEMIGSPAGQHLNDLGLQAYSDAMETAAQDFGRRLPATRDGSNT